MSKLKLLATGSGGCIINNFIRRALFEKLPFEIVSIDKVLKSSVLNNIYANKNHEFKIGDVADEHFVNVIFEIERPDVVIHGANEETNNSNDLIRSNVLGTQVLVDAAIKWGVKKFIYISSGKVYGQLTEENMVESKEDDGCQLEPTSFYGASKAAGELIVKAAGNSHGLNYIITRGANNYGHRQTIDKFIPKTIKAILEGNKIQVYDKGLQVRDWLHVFDYASALIKILECGKNNEVYNVSSNQEFTNIEVVNEICNALGKGFDLIEFVKSDRHVDIRRALNSDKLKALGWKPDYKFKPAIRTTVDWYFNNKYFLK